MGDVHFLSTKVEAVLHELDAIGTAGLNLALCTCPVFFESRSSLPVVACVAQGTIAEGNLKAKHAYPLYDLLLQGMGTRS